MLSGWLVCYLIAALLVCKLGVVLDATCELYLRFLGLPVALCGCFGDSDQPLSRCWLSVLSVCCLGVVPMLSGILSR